jgi:hypothetical protein
MIPAMQLVSGRQYSYEGFQAVFSTHKIISTAFISAQVLNNNNSIIDVGFASGIIDANAITAHSNSQRSYFEGLYDQTNRVPLLQAQNSILTKPYASTVAGIGFTHSDQRERRRGLVIVNNNLPLNMANDYIVDYVFRNELMSNNQRSAVVFNTNRINQKGSYNMAITRAGGELIITVKYTANSVPLGTSEIGYRIPIGTTDSKFTLLTFSFIQGIPILYVNGVVRTAATSFAFALLTSSNKFGIYLGLGYSSISLPDGIVEGSQADVKTATLYCGKNLSTYNITNHINNMKTIHSII